MRAAGQLLSAMRPAVRPARRREQRGANGMRRKTNRVGIDEVWPYNEAHTDKKKSHQRRSIPHARLRRQGSILMKIVVAIAFLLILASLASAFFFLMRDKGKSNRTVQALTLRVGFSVALFLFILLSYKLGWIQPTGIR
jgi:ABC-type bacteriocin/lantibiotic exporter with double-glycine peptidase domain